MQPRRCSVCVANVIEGTILLVQDSETMDINHIYCHNKCKETLISYIKIHPVNILDIKSIIYDYNNSTYVHKPSEVKE